MKYYQTKTVYRYDDNGYLVGDKLVMEDPKHPGQWRIPDTCTELTPDSELLKTHFARFVDGAWTYEEIPTSASYFVGKQVSHKSQKLHDQVLRTLLQKLVEEDSEHYRIVRGSKEEGLWWGVEVIPEKSQDEKDLEQKQAQIATLKYKLSQTDYIAAKLAEGVATKEEYQTQLEERAQWRAEINALETEILALKLKVGKNNE